jgi:hypothetical protein
MRASASREGRDAIEWHGAEEIVLGHLLEGAVAEVAVWVTQVGPLRLCST